MGFFYLIFFKYISNVSPQNFNENDKLGQKLKEIFDIVYTEVQQLHAHAWEKNSHFISQLSKLIHFLAERWMTGTTCYLDSK